MAHGPNANRFAVLVDLDGSEDLPSRSKKTKRKAKEKAQQDLINEIQENIFGDLSLADQAKVLAKKDAILNVYSTIHGETGSQNLFHTMINMVVFCLARGVPAAGSAWITLLFGAKYIEDWNIHNHGSKDGNEGLVVLAETVNFVVNTFIGTRSLKLAFDTIKKYLFSKGRDSNIGWGACAVLLVFSALGVLPSHQFADDALNSEDYAPWIKEALKYYGQDFTTFAINVRGSVNLFNKVKSISHDTLGDRYAFFRNPLEDVARQARGEVLTAMTASLDGAQQEFFTDNDRMNALSKGSNEVKRNYPGLQLALSVGLPATWMATYAYAFYLSAYTGAIRILQGEVVPSNIIAILGGGQRFGLLMNAAIGVMESVLSKIFKNETVIAVDKHYSENAALAANVLALIFGISSFSNAAHVSGYIPFLHGTSSEALVGSAILGLLSAGFINTKDSQVALSKVMHWTEKHVTKARNPEFLFKLYYGDNFEEFMKRMMLEVTELPADSFLRKFLEPKRGTPEPNLPDATSGDVLLDVRVDDDDAKEYTSRDRKLTRVQNETCRELLKNFETLKHEATSVRGEAVDLNERAFELVRACYQADIKPEAINKDTLTAQATARHIPVSP
jgi:hypothetical protein